MKKLVSIIGLLFLLVSCSTEEDLPNRFDNKFKEGSCLQLDKFDFKVIEKLKYSSKLKVSPIPYTKIYIITMPNSSIKLWDRVNCKHAFGGKYEKVN